MKDWYGTYWAAETAKEMRTLLQSLLDLREKELWAAYMRAANLWNNSYRVMYFINGFYSDYLSLIVIQRFAAYTNFVDAGNGGKR